MLKAKKYKGREQYSLYIVHWRDAVFDSDDSKANESFKPEIVISVGWLLKDAKDYIVLCQDYGHDQWVRRRLTIPANMVVEKKVIRAAAPRNGRVRTQKIYRRAATRRRNKRKRRR